MVNNTLKLEIMTSKMEEFINKAVELDLFSGCILVARDGKVIFSKSCGEANKDYNIMNTLKTKFNIASITKPFTATAIMILAQKGLVDISAPVIKYLDDFPFGEKITIHHLLTHTAGLGDYESDPEYLINMNNIRNLEDILNIIYKRKLLFHDPAETMIYSNSGAVVLGAIIEKVTNQGFAEFLNENIFLPLKMANTCFKYLEDVVENRATSYVKKLSGGYMNTSFLVSPPSPATGLQTTVQDLLLFDQALYKNDLLNDEHKKIMFTPFRNNYAYGWGVFERFENTVIGHSGGQPGFNSWFRRYINDKYTIIVLSNLDNGADSVFFGLEAILFGKNYEMPKIPVGEFLYQMIHQESIDKIINNIETILERNNYQIKSPETLNVFGYKLLDQNDPTMAIKVLLLNVSLFKDKVNIFDNLIKELSDYRLSTCLKLLTTDNVTQEQLLRLKPFFTSHSIASRDEEIKKLVNLILSRIKKR